MNDLAISQQGLRPQIGGPQAAPSQGGGFSLATIRGKVIAGAVLLIAMIAAIVVTNQWALSALKLGSPIAEQVVQVGLFQADIAPPRLFLVEADRQLAAGLLEPDNVKYNHERFNTFRKGFYDAKAYWLARDLPPNIRAQLINNLFPKADAYFAEVDGKIWPAIERHDFTTATAIYHKNVRPAFRAYRTEIFKLVDMSNAHATDVRAEAGALNTRFAIATWSVTAIVIAVLAGIIWFALRKIVAPLSDMTGATAALAGGNLDVAIPCEGQADELGRLASAMVVFKGNLKEAEAARKEQEKAVTVVGEALAALSAGNLTHRIDITLTGRLAGLKDNFNAAVERLKETMQVVMGATDGIGTGAGEISQAAEDLSKRTEQQAASLEETAAALEQITATVKRTAANAKEAGKLVDVAKQAAEDGGRVVGTAISAMGQIEQSSKQITDIIGVIDEIAFQTNLLALNAGVEAARAGDAGRGFAVVASEVRALAQRSSDAAKQIKTLIKASGEHVGSGVKLVDETGKALHGIVEQVVSIASLVGEMATAADQQSNGIEEVNVAVGQMDQVTQQNAAMVEQSTAASRNLAHETAELQRLIAFFDIGEKRALAAARREAPRAKPATAPVATFQPRARRSGNAALAVKPAAEAENWKEF